VVVYQRRMHLQGLENSLPDKFNKSDTGRRLYHGPEHVIARIAVFIPFAREKIRTCHFAEQLCCVYIGRNTVGRIDHVVIVGHATRVLQEVPDSHALIGRQIGDVLTHRIFVLQQAVIGQNHDSHCRKLLGNRGQTKIGCRCDWLFFADVSESVMSFVHNFCIANYHYSSPGLNADRQWREQVIDLL